MSTGGAMVPGTIKEIFGPGLCIGVDCVREILQTDARAFLEQSCSLQVHPNGTSDNQVYLVEAYITAASLRAVLRDSLSLQPSFDIITAVNSFTTVPESQKDHVLRQWRTLMKDNSVIGLNFNLLFDRELCPASAAFQVQSASPDFTLPTNRVVPRQDTCGTRKLPPDNMWNGGQDYATQLGNAAGLRVTAVGPIGKNNDFDFPCSGEDGGPPALPSFHDLRTTTVPQIGNILETCGTRGHSDISNAIFALFNRANPSVNNIDRRRRLVEYIGTKYLALEVLNAT